MATYLPARGCIYKTGKGGHGAYSLSGLQGPNLIITGAPGLDQDAIQPVLGLGGKKTIYTFGSGYGQIQITGLVLLGPNGRDSPNLQGFFDSKRVANGGNGVNLSFPGGGYRVYLTGFALGTPDAEYCIQPFGFHALIAKPK